GYRTDVAAALHDLASLQQRYRIGTHRKGNRVFAGRPDRDGAIETSAPGDRGRAVDGAACRLRPCRARKARDDGPDSQYQRLALKEVAATCCAYRIGL